MRTDRPDDHLLACEWLAKFQDRSVVAKWKLAGEVFSSPYYSIDDMNRFRKGMRFSLDHLWETLGEVNLFEEIRSFEIPVVFIQGRKDSLIPGELIERYSSSLVAPRGKELVWLENAGHMPHFEEPDGFQRVVSNAVDRLAGDHSNEQLATELPESSCDPERASTSS